MRILTINPGGTSTKVAIYENEREVFKKTITHTQEALQGFKTLFDQYDYRKKLILDMLEEQNEPLEGFSAIAGRGGLMKAIEGGVYTVNKAMVADLKNAIQGEHASNLGAVLARQIADEAGVEAYVVDPVSTDEFMPVSRLTGLSEIEKASWLHALNHKAVCRKIASKLGGRYEAFNFIVAHLGSGISIAPHARGRMVDGSGGRSDGPFSPERSGGIITYPLVKLCYSGKYSYSEMVDKISNTGGMYDYLGTKDMREIEERALGGDEKAQRVLDAFVYQVAKEIAMYGASLNGDVDRIILTGGIAYSEYVCQEVEKRVRYLAEVEVVPGEMEMEALALGALRVLSGEEAPKVYR
ncbi:butyrate kinase [Acidaminobacter hydrogenoformans]|uniref:Probable butyrate kinase n=1 Tax=Acidaminobacter hydrogenoformans DSM 2784 TaxID=1120920 RepID=A0A1G5S530_9FIRM|nr:butyrate kinase [Acidaminobacter hydrogenoformans]SCZ80861.1 butyrate kinase [Acidaminobacter hydrogenoformans DSM 2784]